MHTHTYFVCFFVCGDFSVIRGERIISQYTRAHTHTHSGNLTTTLLLSDTDKPNFSNKLFFFFFNTLFGQKTGLFGAFL